ncbi:lichenan operon transcriptional antiterminator [Paenibacillus turicensis]|uniref:Lichenan operon transcriptional antiterminator n=1 Tax=Paenibacillus turicensis TaxID=160487 RepID=A0ABS4FLU0_9BACL|nr:BglG family transcription antiterminator [Paenibacillus turicensis]MBP1903496.1 lichenan operon transcriptional antiterminator [Paenibacillus turicensis]
MRELRVINILLSAHPYPVKMSELTVELGLSERTVRDVIRSLEKSGTQHGFCIKMIRGQGYMLQIEDEPSFERYREQGHFKSSLIDLDNKEDRQRYLLFYLLQNNSFTSMEKLADEMGISRSTVVSDLKEVEQRLAHFSLTLNRRAHYGMRIEGDEQNYRKAFSHFVLNNSEFIKPAEEFEQFQREFNGDELRSYLLQVLRQKELKISDVFLNNIVTHIFILLFRVTKNNLIVAGQTMPKTPEPLYRDIAQKIAAWIYKFYEISLPSDEIDYLALHISGKTIIEHISADKKKQLREGISSILQRLDEEFLTSFNEDEHLREALLLHMFPLLNRLYYNLQLNNPLVEDVYSQYANVFVISFRFAEIIEEEYGFWMSRDEAGYVALHFATHLERMKQRKLEQFKRIAVICSTGGGSAQLIRLKLESVFPNASVITASENEMDEIAKKPIDLILTTVPLETHITDKPVIHIKHLLDDSEVHRIKEIIAIQINHTQPSYKFIDFKELFRPELFHLDGPDQYMDLLTVRCEEIVQHGFAEAEFVEQVLVREEKFTTIYTHGVAGPHPMRMSAIKDCINVTILPKPIVSEGKSAQFIFVINLRAGQLFLHKEISKLLLLMMEKEEIRKALAQVTSFEQFMKEIENLL